MADLTLRETDTILKKRGQKLALNFAGGQYHAYIFQGETLSRYERGDDLSESVERALTERASQPVSP